MKYRDEIESLDPDIGLRSLLSRHPDDLINVEVNESSILLDIDTPEDYLKLLKTQNSYGKTH
jgi:molybdenum cofactor cytidylyltransferase